MTKGLLRSLRRAPAQRQTIHNITIDLNALAISVVGATGVGFGSAVAGDFPQGNILFLGATANLQFSGSGSDANLADTWEGDFGLGTTPMGDATISAGDEDLIAETAIAAATAEVSPITRGVVGAGLTAVLFDNTDGSLEMNLNLLIDDADIGGTSPITVDGQIYIAFIVLGDD